MRQFLSILIFGLVAVCATSQADAQRGDFDADGDVDIVDYDLFIQSLIDGDNNPAGDIDCDGSVTGSDVSPMGELVMLGRGDVNRDGSIDFDDINAFIAVLQGGTNDWLADINGDCAVDFDDIPPFIVILQAQ